MKLLFDHNLSHKLVDRLADLFPGSNHIRNAALHDADDHRIWEFARINGFAIVSKDEDFHQLSFLHGAPPKVIWIRLGNCTTTDTEATLRSYHTDLLQFNANEESAFLIIGTIT